MIADLKPYPEYKESGLPWLGQVPEHWEVKRAKSIFHRIDQRSQTGKEELLTVSSARGIVPRKTASVTMFKAESYLGYKLCWPGDLVINSLWAWAGGLGVSNHHGIISSAYGVYRIRHNAAMTPAFVHEVVRSSSFNWELKVRSKGVWISRLQLTDVSFLDAPMHIPPLTEQAAIVRFLDWAKGRLGRAIRAKRKVIALLTEQKQAIIHRAVTRGLDLNVPLKPSGIPWLGDIPTHWNILPTKRCTSVISKGTTPSTEGREILEAGPVRFLKVENIAGNAIVNKPLVFISQETHNVLRRSQLQEGDVLFVIAGATLGKIAIIQPEHLPANTNQAVAFLRPNTRVAPEFLALWLQSPRIKEQTWLNAVQSAQPNLSMGSLGMFYTPLPPRPEQMVIVQAIESNTADFSSSISRLEREIELLREYRTRLVADVVTGKLDVREAAARLPEDAAPDTEEDIADEIDEIEASDDEAAV
jgi:type I restriction enzyme S subunit